MLAVLAMLVAAATVLGAVRATHGDRVMPRVFAGGVDLGGLTRAQARARLTGDARRSILVRAPGRALRLQPAAAGRVADIDAALNRALRAGRNGALGGLFSTAALAVRAPKVNLVVGVDEKKLERTVQSLARRIDRPASAGALAIDADTLAVATRPPAGGLALDRPRLRRDLRRALLQQTDEVTAVVGRSRAATRAELEKVARAAEDYLRSGLELSGSATQLTLAPRRLAAVLAVRIGRDDRVQLGADPARVRTLVEGVALQVGRPARPPSFRATSPGGIVDGKGDVTWRPRRTDLSVSPGRPGRELDRSDAAKRIAAAIRENRHRASIRLRDVRSPVTVAQARRAKRLIGTFTTYYTPAPRVTNIRLIASVVDGTIIPAGATFSLNGVAGERTSAEGYVKAPFIADGKLEDTIGGGVSQFSTTMYNAAFFAGLRLDRHQPHSFFIDRYPAGRESTLNFPDIDLTWTNDTDVPVLIRAAGDASSVTVRLYGDNNKRRVKAITGARTPVSGRNFAITVTREIRYGDGRRVRQPVTTTYDNPPAGE